MAVGLALTGHLPDGERLSRTEARDWLARAAMWFEAVGDAVLDTRLVRDADEKPILLAAFHPAAEPIELRLGASGKVRLAATTSPAGPGYHAYLCRTLKLFANDFGFTWDTPAPDLDPGRYFVVADATKLETHFDRWLSARCAALLASGGPYWLGMPRQPAFLHPGPVLTPLGPKPLDWLRVVSADAACGRGFFPWWKPDLDAAFYRGRALAELWLEFRGAAPRTEAEGEQIDQVAADLANAFDLNPDLDLPWAAWADVIAAIEQDALGCTVEPVSAQLKAEVRRRAEGQPAEIGYRRHPVRVALSGHWHITIPGRFAAAWDEDHRAWSAWDAGRSVWFRGTHLSEEGPTPAVAFAAARRGLPPGDAVPAAGLMAATFGPHTDDGKSVWRLSGVAAAAGSLAACNIYFADPDDRAWAVGVWQSLGRDA